MIPKFRAWLKDEKELANVTNISYEGSWVVNEPLKKGEFMDGKN
ncbi:hypothetical protein [Enterococcus hirae]|nr:hypothetical protein [Enterococcus hirae]